MTLMRAWDRLTLAAVPSAVSCARAFATYTLRWWEATHVMDDALLVVSELVTNAVTATGPKRTTPTWTDVKAEHVLGVQLRVVDMRLYVEVWDRSRELPGTKHPTADIENGRGLLLVEALTKRWGTSRSPVGGKVVWAELELSTPPTLTVDVPPLPHRVPAHVRVPEGASKDTVDTALMERVLEGLRDL